MRQRTHGLTLVETIVAVAILAAAFVVIIPAFSTNLFDNTRQEVRLQASAAAQQVFDATRRANPDLLPMSGSDAGTDVLVGGRTFKVYRDFCVQTALCGTGSRNIRVRVVYNSENIFSAETVFTQVNYVNP